MKTRFTLAALVCGALVLTGVYASVKDITQINQRNGPPNFSSLEGVGDFCTQPNLLIGQVTDPNNPNPASSTQNVSSALFIQGELAVDVQIEHAFIGDLQIEVANNNSGNSTFIAAQSGWQTNPDGCSGDDMDARFIDSAATSVDAICGGAVPAVAGDMKPCANGGTAGNPGCGPLSVFSGSQFGGDWTLSITDIFPDSDDGTLVEWCVTCIDCEGGTATTGGAVPATSTWGVIALITLFMGVSLFYLRRRSASV
jgi:hypothetical protein